MLDNNYLIKMHWRENIWYLLESSSIECERVLLDHFVHLFRWHQFYVLQRSWLKDEPDFVTIAPPVVWIPLLPAAILLACYLSACLPSAHHPTRPRARCNWQGGGGGGNIVERTAAAAETAHTQKSQERDQTLQKVIRLVDRLRPQEQEEWDENWFQIK